MNPQPATEHHNPATTGAEAQTSNPVLLDEVIAASERRISLDMKLFEHKQRLANLFAKSGCFGDIKKDISQEQAIAQAFVKIELGESMGFTAAESMQGVHLINGTPAVNAQLRAARMQRAGFHWDIDWFDSDQGVCEGCRLWLYRNGRPLMKVVRDLAGNIIAGENGQPLMEQVSVAFLKKDAEMLKTTMWGETRGEKKTVSVLEKDNWKNTPRNMYFARAITNAQRFHAAGVLSGEIPSTEEAMDFGIEDEDDHGRGSFEAQQAILQQKLAEAARWKESQRASGTKPEATETKVAPTETTQPEAETKETVVETPGWNDAKPAADASKPKLPGFGGRK
jgi:hypothetical protein